jgi:ABC-type Fe3+/spermidine/putrescine transport system ATPase subunit
MTEVRLITLSKSYGDGDAVQDLSLDIRSGEMIGLLGPSGCGKTTTLKMIAGLLRPSHGDITFDGASVLSVPPEKRGGVMVFQNHLLFPYMSVADNVGFGLRMHNAAADERRRRVSEALEMVHLTGYEERRPSDLSGGQQQRVALARALVTKPRVLLLDEPLSNLDAHLRLEMRNLILHLQRQQRITTIFVTHDQQEAVILADRTALIFEGKLQQFGPPRDFYERPASKRVASFFGTENFLPGVKSGNRVETALGTLEIGDLGLADGKVTLAIRPESVILGANGPNRVTAMAESSLYTGTGTQIAATANGVRLQILAGPHEKRQAGETVIVSLPPERIIVLPGAGTS